MPKIESAAAELAAVYEAMPVEYRDRWIEKVAVESECIVWQASKDPKGYGQLRVGSRLRKAHILAWAALHGDVPAGLVLDHEMCSRPACGRPSHLVPKSIRSNSRRRSGLSAANTSGYTGASWQRRESAWHAMVQLRPTGEHMRTVSLGYWSEAAHAGETARRARVVMYGGVEKCPVPDREPIDVPADVSAEIDAQLMRSLRRTLGKPWAERVPGLVDNIEAYLGARATLAKYATAA